MIEKMQQLIEKHQMILPGDYILLGVSGGADSVCLFRTLHQLRASMGFEMEVLHVEHGIRGQDSIADARFVENLCRAYEVPFQCFCVNVPDYAYSHHLGDEEAARILRYEVFQKMSQKRRKEGFSVKIALAHHMDDNAETILFQMIRGSGLTGMCGMQPIRYDEDGNCYIRPLLSVSRVEVEAWLKQRNQEYRMDATNYELDYSRNRIRNIILPELTKLNKQAVLHMNQTAERLNQVRRFVENQKDREAEKLIVREKGRIGIDVKGLETADPVIAQEIVRQVIFEAAGKRKDITAGHVADVLALCQQQSGKRVHLPYGIQARKEYDWLFLEKKKETAQKKPSYLASVTKEQLLAIFTNGEKLRIPFADGKALELCVRSYEGNEAEIPKKPYTKWLDYDMIKDGFLLRNRQPGDFFFSDSLGHRKKLKEYFIDEKIPMEQRNQKILLAQEARVFWIIGGRIDAQCKITKQTKYILEIKYNGGE